MSKIIIEFGGLELEVEYCWQPNEVSIREHVEEISKVTYKGEVVYNADEICIIHDEHIQEIRNIIHSKLKQ